jgi:hypothetical protein
MSDNVHGPQGARTSRRLAAVLQATLADPTPPDPRLSNFFIPNFGSPIEEHL